MSRVFLMKWYHFTVEYFEDLRNVNHCEFLIMRRQENAKYLLENKLRTWSELRRERERAAAANKDKANGDSKGSASPAKIERNKSIVVSARRWGGCPNGCDHGNHYKRREDLEIMRQQDMENTNMGFGTDGIRPPTTATSTIASRRHHQRGASSDEDDGEDPRANGSRANIASLDVKGIAEEIVSSPDGTPSFISPEDRLRILKYSPNHHNLRAGRDFGGTYSGRTSQAGSDSEMSEDERRRRRSDPLVSLQAKKSQPDIVVRGQVDVTIERAEEDDDRVRKHALANRLGDTGSDQGDDGDQEDAGLEDLDRAEAEDRSIRGSVY